MTTYAQKATRYLSDVKRPGMRNATLLFFFLSKHVYFMLDFNIPLICKSPISGVLVVMLLKGIRRASVHM